MLSRVALAAALLAGASGALAADDPAERGFAVAMKHCASCHALDGVHESPRPGAPGFPDVGRRFVDRELDRRLLEVTRRGHYAMPPRALAADDRSAVAAYIRAAAAKAAPGGEF